MRSYFAFTPVEAVDVTGRPLRHSVDEAAFRRSVLSLLDANTLCSMATVTSDGRAHINTAYFAFSERLELFFLSHPSSVHCRNLLSNPSMAVTVFSSSQQWTEPDRGAQLFGECEQATGTAAHEAERSYGARFAGYDQWKAAHASDELARAYRFYRLEIGTVRVLDEESLGDAVFVRANVLRD